MALSSERKMTAANYQQLYVSWASYTFDILSFIAISYVIAPVAQQIYPSKAIGISLLVVWGGFAAGALTRPLGAAIYGRTTDIRGRKRALYYNIAGSSIFTALIAATPTYSQVGILAPVIFIALRLIAGVFIGGLVAVGLVYGPENFPERFRGVLTGFAESGGSWAHVIGASWLLMITLVFTGAAYATVGWRVMFLVALLPLALILPVLHYIPESNIFTLSKKKGKIGTGTLRTLLVTKSSLRNAFYLMLGLSVGLLGYDNLTENQFPSFLGVVNHTPPSTIAFIVLIGSFAGVIGSVFGGGISQFVGRKRTGIIGGVVLILLSPLYYYLGQTSGKDTYTLMLILIPFFLFASISKADLSLVLNENFPTALRGSALGLNWNMGYGLAGVWPLIITAAVAVYGVGVYGLASAIFIGVLAIIYTISSLFTIESRGNIAKEEAELATAAGPQSPASP